ncbi:hypothetical protein K3172_04260 [Qipengyuania sp. 6B39]|uniref:hypothetical protein n=1 Tax=Qipengyuania proteolytica TaxID=2867239 RepID=UPI001C8AEC39|nr:hypothetical protein [Qipengyuania proteolytica]MBX7495069.1 hypothetical protein [Qipengyuania proteolytica]
MTNQIISLSAQFADLGGPAGIAARLTEPSGLTMIGLALAGIVVGRFLLNRSSH